MAEASTLPSKAPLSRLGVRSAAAAVVIVAAAAAPLLRCRFAGDVNSRDDGGDGSGAVGESSWPDLSVVGFTDAEGGASGAT
jgi:hypothetical protein